MDALEVHFGQVFIILNFTYKNGVLFNGQHDHQVRAVKSMMLRPTQYCSDSNFLIYSLACL